MRKLITTALAALSLTALAEFGMNTAGKEPALFTGKAVGFSVRSGTADNEVTLNRIRNWTSYTNGTEIITTSVTNTYQMFNNSNGVWYVTNIVKSVTTTNSVVLLEKDVWVTNEIIKAACAGGFATSNIVNGAWFVPGDFIFIDGTADDYSATVIFEK